MPRRSMLVLVIPCLLVACHRDGVPAATPCADERDCPAAADWSCAADGAGRACRCEPRGEELCGDFLDSDCDGHANNGCPVGWHPPIRVAQTLHQKLDVLFVIDSSNSMEAMSAELRNRFPAFSAILSDRAGGTDGAGLDLHLGVIDTDFGAGKTGAPGCTPSGPRGGGTQGKLQAIGKAAAMGCRRPIGANYLAYARRPDGRLQPPLQRWDVLLLRYPSCAAGSCRPC